MEAEASPNRLPIKVIRNSGGYVSDNALVVTVNTTIFLLNRYGLKLILSYLKLRKIIKILFSYVFFIFF